MDVESAPGKRTIGRLTHYSQSGMAGLGLCRELVLCSELRALIRGGICKVLYLDLSWDFFFFSSLHNLKKTVE